MTQPYGLVADIDSNRKAKNSAAAGDMSGPGDQGTLFELAPVSTSSAASFQPPWNDCDAAPPATTGARSARTRSALSAFALWFFGSVAVLGAVIYVHQWWTVSRFLQSTNDGYLRADQVAMAPRVSGYVMEVLVEENQLVQIGQPLVRVEAAGYGMALARQQATVDARVEDSTAADARVQRHIVLVEQASAKLEGSQIDARFASREAERYRSLSVIGAESAERLSQMVHNRDQANAAVRFDSAALSAAEHQTKILQAEAGQARAQAKAARAAASEADLDVADTLIRASIAGRVGDRTVRAGQFVQPGTRLLSIVPVKDIYVVANFKETQIGDMRVGQPAAVSVDALRGRVLRGVLDSFAPGTGAQFALLPPENATGNFTKIVQRVPVRFRLEIDDDTRARLLPGLSVTVEIDTRNHGSDAEGRS